jgi:DNA sulfur modification protein DndE
MKIMKAPVILTSFFCFVFSVHTYSQEKNIDYYIQHAPFKMSNVAIPAFADKKFSITDFGGVNDGITLNTLAIAKAIDACTKAGGGMVIVPAGNWLTGPIELKSNVDLHLEHGAFIQFTKDHTQYPIIRAGNNSNSFTPASPIYAYDATNIAITGDGVIDGAGDSWRPVKKEKANPGLWADITKSGVISKDGKVWWPSFEAISGEEYLKKLKDRTNKPAAEDFLPARDYLRPYMLYLVHCDNILIQGVTLKNSPKFIFYPNHCTNITMYAVNVYNDWWAQNGDAIDISACKNVVIYKCTVNAGDDGICMKSSGGRGGDNAELENIVIAQCTVFRAHGGFVIGSNTDGGMRNIYVSDCNFIGTDIGIRVKSNAGRGGLVKNIYVENIIMKNIIHEAVLFNTYYEDVPAGKDIKDVKTTVADKVPEFTEFHISNIKCDGAKQAISIVGLPQQPVHHIYFENVNIKADRGFESVDAADIDLKNVTIDSHKPIYETHGCKNIHVHD